MPNQSMLDDVANDLALWIDQTSTQIALGMMPRGVAPFAAPLSETQKLEYYRDQLFNPDGTPNLAGRNAQAQRLGPQGFTMVYRTVIKAYPQLRLPTPPVTAGPPPVATETIANLPHLASGGIVTQPTVAVIGEAGPEAVVPLTNASQPLTDAGQLASPETRAQILRDYGWSEAAIQQVQRVPTYVPATSSPVPGTYGGYTEGSQPGDVGSISLYQPDINFATWRQVGLTPGGLATASPEAIWEHEAHHAYDALNPQVGQNVLYGQDNNAAVVLNDLNTLRQYAAVQGNRELYDAANAAMAATSNDPTHVNHYMVYAGTIEGAPDWYLAKYFPFIQGAPTWSGAQANSAPLTLQSSRLQGDTTYTPGGA